MGASSLSIQWPSDFRPAGISKAFDSASGQLQIAAPTGTVIRAGLAGKVTAVSSSSVQVSSGGFALTLANLKNIKVQVGQAVAADAAIGESAGAVSINVTLTQVLDPTPLIVMPAAPAPVQPTEPTQPTTPTQPSADDQDHNVPPASDKKLYITPNQNGIRIRARPVDGEPIGQAGLFDILEVLEDHTAARAKLGVEGQWVNVRKLLDNTIGFSAAQFMKLYDGPDPLAAPTPTVPGLLNILGMNLDMHNPLGRPTPSSMKGVGWIRVKFNVSFNPDNHTFGNTDVNATFNRMKPFLEPYVKAGIKVLVVYTHQLFGEGAGFNWPDMNTGRWNDLIPKYADFARRASALLFSAGLVHAYQIWNEQDTPPAVARAAVPIPSRDYANLMTQTIRAIRTVDKVTPIITGGHVGGPDRAGVYARETLAAMGSDVRPDGIASHPYGRGVQGNMFSPFGSLEEEIRKTTSILPGKPMWITEWGVLDKQGQNDLAGKVLDYAQGFMNIIKSQFRSQVAAAIWYAWADGMDNGYGVVDASNKQKAALYDKFLQM